MAASFSQLSIRGRYVRDNELCETAGKLWRRINNGSLKRNMNILLLGATGVGKSTLINSLIMALNDEGYNEFAQHGTYGEGGYHGKASYTGKLRKFDISESIPSCAGAGSGSGRQTKVSLWDFSGLPDELDPRICTIAELLLDGHLPVGTTYKSLSALSSDTIRNKYSTFSKERMIHVVLYVHASTDPVQENLVDAIGELARDDIREIPVFLIVTKMDKITSHDHQRHLEANIQTISRPMALLGAREKLFKLKLYCDEVSPDMKRKADVDEELCKLWNRILSPGYAVEREPPSNTEVPEVFNKSSSYKVPFAAKTKPEQAVVPYQQPGSEPLASDPPASYSGYKQQQPAPSVFYKETKEEYHHHHHHHHQQEQKKKKWCLIS